MPLSNRIVIGYGLPGLVTAIPIIPIAILLPSYYALDLGLGFFLTGIALGGARLIDFSSDIIIGILVDRFRWTRPSSNSLQFKPWLILGGGLAALGLYQLAHPSYANTQFGGAIYLALWSNVLFLGWTIIMVPYTAWGAMLSDDHHERSKLAVARESAGIVGMLIALTAPGLFPDTHFSPLALLCWLTIGLGIPIMVFALLTVPETTSSNERSPVIETKFSDIVELLRFPPYRFTVTAWFINGLANGVPAVLFPIVVQQYLSLEETSLFALLFIYFGAGILAAPVWVALAKRWGKINTWQIAICMNILVFATVLLIDPTSTGFFSPTLFYWICAFSGASLSADMALPASIQADVMEADRRQNGKIRTATAFALWSMATKLALAVAIAVGFISLGLSGGGLGDSTQASTPAPTLVLLSLYVCLPVTLKSIVLYMLGKFPHNELVATGGLS